MDWMNRSLAGGKVLKSLGLTRSGVSDTFSVLLDHLICSSQNVGWNRKSDLLGGLQIDDEFKLLRLLDGQVGRFCSIEDLVAFAVVPQECTGFCILEATIRCRIFVRKKEALCS
jgi:hypothetical protein